MHINFLQSFKHDSMKHFVNSVKLLVIKLICFYLKKKNCGCSVLYQVIQIIGEKVSKIGQMFCGSSLPSHLTKLQVRKFQKSIVLFTSSGVWIVIFFSHFLLLKKNQKKRGVISNMFLFPFLDFNITFFVTLLDKVIIGINPKKTNFRLNFTLKWGISDEGRSVRRQPSQHNNKLIP